MLRSALVPLLLLLAGCSSGPKNVEGFSTWDELRAAVKAKPAPLRASPEQLASVEREPATLRYRWTVGQTWTTRTTTVLNTEVAAAGERSGKTAEVSAGGPNLEIWLRYRCTVESVDASGRAVLCQVLEAARGILRGDEGERTLDTEEGLLSNNSDLDVYAHMVGVPLRYTVTDRGRVERVQGGAALRAKLEEDVTGYSDTDLVTNAQHQFTRFPSQELQPGETWKQELSARVGKSKHPGVEEYLYLGTGDFEGTPCAKFLVRRRLLGKEDVADDDAWAVRGPAECEGLLYAALADGFALQEPNRAFDVEILVGNRDGGMVVALRMKLTAEFERTRLP